MESTALDNRSRTSLHSGSVSGWSSSWFRMRAWDFLSIKKWGLLELTPDPFVSLKKFWTKKSLKKLVLQHFSWFVEDSSQRLVGERSKAGEGKSANAWNRESCHISDGSSWIRNLVTKLLKRENKLIKLLTMSVSSGALFASLNHWSYVSRRSLAEKVKSRRPYWALAQSSSQSPWIGRDMV